MQFFRIKLNTFLKNLLMWNWKEFQAILLEAISEELMKKCNCLDSIACEISRGSIKFLDNLLTSERISQIIFFFSRIRTCIFAPEFQRTFPEQHRMGLPWERLRNFLVKLWKKLPEEFLKQLSMELHNEFLEDLLKELWKELLEDFVVKFMKEFLELFL